MLKGMHRLLKQYGYEVVPFETAGALRDHHDLHQALCIVLDINLSDGSGIELRHQLQRSGVTAPVIYVTGNDSEATRTAAMESGCVAYLTKPFPARSLIDPIEKAVAAQA